MIPCIRCGERIPKGTSHATSVDCIKALTTRLSIARHDARELRQQVVSLRAKHEKLYTPAKIKECSLIELAVRVSTLEQKMSEFLEMSH